MFNFEKQTPVSDAEWPQDSNGAICFSVRGLEPPPPQKKIMFDCMTSPLAVML